LYPTCCGWDCRLGVSCLKCPKGEIKDKEKSFSQLLNEVPWDQQEVEKKINKEPTALELAFKKAKERKNAPLPV
jgi:hypothetical protein